MCLKKADNSFVCLLLPFNNAAVDAYCCLSNIKLNVLMLLLFEKKNHSRGQSYTVC